MGFVWFVPPSELASRLELDFVGLLVGQAFKLVIAETLPNLTYLTLLDICKLGHESRVLLSGD